ncbi:MAG: Txe/YoeB family addiction module toxin [Gammaproteobacteria bacterium]|nr:Txe/YoeB family addiction module toxin [Gammaproteobacteria bacterium]
MKLVWTDIAWDEYLYWKTADIKKLSRINDLIKNIQETPFQGIGKPEPLRFDLAGKWSRKIDNEHRLVYAVSGKKEKIDGRLVDNQVLIIYQCKYHY